MWTQGPSTVVALTGAIAVTAVAMMSTMMINAVRGGTAAPGAAEMAAMGAMVTRAMTVEASKASARTRRAC